MYRTFFSLWMRSQGLCVASTQEFSFLFLRFHTDEGREGDAMQWMWLRSGGNRRKRRRRRAGRYAAKRCNKEMRIFRLSFMCWQDRSLILRQAFSRSTPAKTLDPRRRRRRVIRNRCLFYETFYLATQPAFQYFARLSPASFTTFSIELSFSIFTVLSRFMLGCSFSYDCVPLRLSSREWYILFKPVVGNQRCTSLRICKPLD